MEKIADDRDKLNEMLKILRCIANGKSNTEISILTGNESKSVRWKISWLKNQFQVHNTAALIHAAHTHGLIYVNESERADWIDYRKRATG